jgi:hypothetical protein
VQLSHDNIPELRVNLYLMLLLSFLRCCCRRHAYCASASRLVCSCHMTTYLSCALTCT